MAKTAKGKKKKKNFKLRRQLRKTFGCLFMISALLVTAIPVTPMEAATGEWDTESKPWVTSKTATNKGGEIPYLDPAATRVYQTEDGTFRFAYVDESGKSDSTTANMFAVIIGYDKAQTLPGGENGGGGVLKIPDNVDAYVKYADEGSTGGFAAANAKGKPLYYKEMVTETYWVNETTNNEYQIDGSWSSGEQVVKKTRQKMVKMQPCTSERKPQWSPEGVDVELYFFSGTATSEPTLSDLEPDMTDPKNPKPKAVWTMVSNTADRRIKNARVDYIGNQMAELDANGNWVVGADCDAGESIFGGEGKNGEEAKTASNITTLIIGPNLKGVGDYAFNNCFNIESISFSNGLSTLGNYSFSNCGNLVSVEMPYNARIATLGDHAFYNCGSLQTFAMPTYTMNIGDSCFENCINLKSIDMIRKNDAAGSGDEQLRNSNLRQIGYLAFKGCTALESLTFPRSYEGADHDGKNYFHLSTVDGCKSLKFISTQSSKIDFVSDAAADGGSGTVDGTYSFEEFRNDVGDTFYIEGIPYVNEVLKTKTPIHNTANIKEIAFKYYGEDKYEIVKASKGYIGGSTVLEEVGLVYAVDSAGELIDFRVEDRRTGSSLKAQVPEVDMPDRIGPYGIKAIAKGSFNDNCWVQKIIVPASLEYVRAEAFKGCHNLRHIIFRDAKNIVEIGSNAFATQQIDASHINGGADANSCKDERFLEQAPIMTFTGAIVKDDGTNTEPFKFAMKAASKINEGRQPLSYITYYSEFPTNLTVRYNPDTQMAELQDFPRKSDVASGYVNPDYKPGDVHSDKYLYPSVTDAISAEAAGAFPSGASENQAAMRDAVENIVIPNGVTSIKTGLFSGVDNNGNLLEDADGSDGSVTVSGNKPDKDWVYKDSQDVKTLTIQSIAEIIPYTFARMGNLEKVYINATNKIGDYAFDSCPKLNFAEISTTTTELGKRPFSGCNNLADVSFPPGADGFAYFTCEDGIIYDLAEDGQTKEKIVQCLGGRGMVKGSKKVGPDELEGIKEIAEEAFMGNENVNVVDLTKTTITSVPSKTFADMESLFQVILPDTTRLIGNGAFWNTKSLGYVTIPNSVTNIAPNAFGFTEDDGETFDDEARMKSSFEFVCLPDSNASDYASLYDYIGTTTDKDLKVMHSVFLYDALDPNDWKLIEERRIQHDTVLELTDRDAPDHTAEGYMFSEWFPSASIYNPIVADREIRALYVPIGATLYTVRFFNSNGEVMEDYTQKVEAGKAARAPSKDEMEVEGKVFTGWDRDITNINSDLDVFPIYVDRVQGMYYVTFWTDMDMTEMIGRVQEVEEGGSAIEPAHPTKEGYTFSKWSSDAWQNVTKDLDIFAVYVEGDGNGDGPNNPDDPNNPDKPNKPGDNNNNGSGGGSGDDSNGDDDNSVSGNGTKYKVVVNGGSGSGEYTAGTIVPINAYAKADGTVFDKWTSSSNGVGFVSQTAISTTFTMPANNVEITANFKVGSSSSTVSGNSRSTRRNSATAIDISKGGISNTDIASANVNGSSDNFVVKVTDDATATAAVIAALEARYGDLTNIAYLPMDISLYDSTGTTKITDVSGITVDITLPLPDDLIQYAGNNRAGSVSNGRLEELNTKFTTIDGVPCVQFTATHFSPYTIYVDTANLSAGTIDSTPKTGDPIHPKWFLAMGLACISVILFCKKDKQPKMKHA